MATPLFIRPYVTSDREACLALFDANCPGYFAPNERANYETFLNDSPPAYSVCLEGDAIIGAFGVLPGSDAGKYHLNWILLAPHAQGRGMGSAIMKHAVASARRSGARRLAIAASHRSAPFFARFGAQRLAYTPDGWGPGMHRVDMELDLTRLDS
jgi:GNAT superfamily N-acetyltransferase